MPDTAFECAAALDVLVVCGARTREVVDPGKEMLIRVVSMLSRMTERSSGVREHEGTFDYDHEHDYDHDR